VQPPPPDQQTTERPLGTSPSSGGVPGPELSVSRLEVTGPAAALPAGAASNEGAASNAEEPGRRATLALASIGVLLAAADTYVVVLALPDMMLGAGLGVDQLERATPIISAFLLGYVATLPLIGRLADLRGSRRVLIGCLLLFALGSLVTAAATDLGTLVTGRALQGVGGGGLVPATLALVAQAWPPERRGVPLGAVGAVQETGSVLGPLLGAGILAVSDWRVIFWANLGAAVVLAIGLVMAGTRTRPALSNDTVQSAGDPADGSASRPGAGYWARRGLALIAVLALGLFLLAPDRLVYDVRLGQAWAPLASDRAWTSPLGLVIIALGAGLLADRVADPGVRTLARQVDAAGSALIAGALAGLVLSFATADPEQAALSPSAPWLLGGSAVLLAAFVVRQRMASAPLVPPGTLRRSAAWGALVVNLLIGVALVAALVDIPLFARATSQPDQLGAAMVLMRLLIAVPVGAFAGGWAIRRIPVNIVASFGMLVAAAAMISMTQWDDSTLIGLGGSASLLLAGFGFGLAIAPVNAALLAATDPSVHGVASALVVVARMVGMLTGISVLTAVGLRVFYREQERIGTVLELCPRTPGDCPAYTNATHAALLTELHTIFAAAGACAALAGVLCLVLLRAPSTAPSTAPVTRSRW
jgi:MFS family permease